MPGVQEGKSDGHPFTPADEETPPSAPATLSPPADQSTPQVFHRPAGRGPASDLDAKLVLENPRFNASQPSAVGSSTAVVTLETVRGEPKAALTGHLDHRPSGGGLPSGAVAIINTLASLSVSERSHMVLPLLMSRPPQFVSLRCSLSL